MNVFNETMSDASHVQKRQEDGIGLAQPAEHHGVILSTGNDIPGYRIVKNHGIVYGITVRSRNIGASLGAVVKSFAGGELKSMTKNVVRSRNEALDRMISGVQAAGANGVYAFRFDAGAIGEGWTEICCYGTAVTVEPIGEKSA
ncbi:hypothetical protein TRICI_004387 [Trichomonascus ciferrii]|uniref:Uncharacterized protein n=1 Tax=Trichomonascus ciferrii TaxID=44093 RepID=A0A642V0T2_9ASCO|nr:hypothetical protein TRICI_004387 [Trichomonascus ciferrii]